MAAISQSSIARRRIGATADAPSGLSVTMAPVLAAPYYHNPTREYISVAGRERRQGKPAGSRRRRAHGDRRRRPRPDAARTRSLSASSRSTSSSSARASAPNSISASTSSITSFAQLRLVRAHQASCGGTCGGAGKASARTCERMPGRESGRVSRLGNNVHDGRMHLGPRPEDGRRQDAHHLRLALALDPHAQRTVILGPRPRRDPIGQLLLDRHGHRVGRDVGRQQVGNHGRGDVVRQIRHQLETPARIDRQMRSPPPPEWPG